MNYFAGILAVYLWFIYRRYLFHISYMLLRVKILRLNKRYKSGTQLSNFSLVLLLLCYFNLSVALSKPASNVIHRWDNKTIPSPPINQADPNVSLLMENVTQAF